MLFKNILKLTISRPIDKSLKILWLLALMQLFFPVIGLLAQFSGNLQIAATAFQLAPSWMVSSAEVDRITFEARAQAELNGRHTLIQAGRIQLRLAPVVNAGEWQKAAVLAVDELSRLLPGNPPLPVIETRKLFDNYGRMDNPFTLAIDPSGDEPMRTMAHEFTHLYLLWALIPGFPVDCPRWFNEGMAEFVSGKLAGDENGWNKAAMINQCQLVPLSTVSPAFSWSGWQVEWHAREAVAQLFDQEGETGVRRLITGLRYARPFHSLFPIVTGKDLSTFEDNWLKRMKDNRVIENFSCPEIASRAMWIAENRGFVELQPLIKDLSENFLPMEQKRRLADIAKLNEARRAMALGNLNDAHGWLHGVDRNISGYLPLLEQLVAAGRISKQNLTESSPDAAVKAETGNLTMPPGLLSVIAGWFMAFLSSALLMVLYAKARSLMLPGLISCWSGNGNKNQIFRWLVTGATGLGGSWFLRFLVISMIPYSGLSAINDLNRILLAEVLIVFLWLGLAWQLKRWSGPMQELTTPAVKFVWQRFNRYWTMFLPVAAVPPLLSAWQNGWQKMHLPIFQSVLAVLVLTAGAGAFSLAVWRAVRRWHSPGSTWNLTGPAVIYAIFRGGLLADSWGSFFALVAGYRISQLVVVSKCLWLGLVADIALMLPALILTVGWFPAVDPVAGIWYGGDRVVIWWLLPALALLLCRFPIESKKSD